MENSLRKHTSREALSTTEGPPLEWRSRRNPEQKFLYLPNGASDKIEILDRKTLQIVGSFGRGGEFAGEWHWLHTLAVDSKGNIYTAESRGNRVQKFRLTGFSPAAGSPAGS